MKTLNLTMILLMLTFSITGQNLEDCRVKFTLHFVDTTVDMTITDADINKQFKTNLDKVKNPWLADISKLETLNKSVDKKKSGHTIILRNMQSANTRIYYWEFARNATSQEKLDCQNKLKSINTIASAPKSTTVYLLKKSGHQTIALSYLDTHEAKYLHFLRNATEKEIKAYSKQQKKFNKVKVSGKFGIIEDKYLIRNAIEYFRTNMMVEKMIKNGPFTNPQIIRNDSVIYYGIILSPDQIMSDTTIIKNNKIFMMRDFDKSNPEKINDTMYIKGDDIYQKRSAYTSQNLPAFYLANKAVPIDFAKTFKPTTPHYSSNEDLPYIELPIGIKPFFEIKNLPSTLTLKKLVKNTASYWAGMSKVILNAYVFDYNNKQNLIYIDTDESAQKFFLSVEKLQEKKKRRMEFANYLEKNKKEIENLKNLQISLVKTFVLYNKNPEILSAELTNQNELKLEYKYNETVDNSTFPIIYETIKTGNITQKTGIVNAPVYLTNCFEQIPSQLLTDTKNDPELEKQLLSTLKKDKEWSNYEILDIVLKEFSEWELEKDYSNFTIGRHLKAGVYAKDKKDGKCYYITQVIFYQRNDLQKGFIADIEVKNSPAWLNIGGYDTNVQLYEFPCNLK